MRKKDTKGQLLTQVNVSIRDLATGSESAPVEWEFFCECGAPECHEQVLLTLESYGAIHDHGFPIIAPGHRVNQPARAARLRQEAHALRAQAEHQMRRAKRNMARAHASGVVYFTHDRAMFAVDAAHAEAIAAANPGSVMAAEILARLTTGSSKPIDLDLPGYAAEARAALEAMSPDARQVDALRAVLR